MCKSYDLSCNIIHEKYRIIFSTGNSYNHAFIITSGDRVIKQIMRR